MVPTMCGWTPVIWRASFCASGFPLCITVCKGGASIYYSVDNLYPRFSLFIGGNLTDTWGRTTVPGCMHAERRPAPAYTVLTVWRRIPAGGLVFGERTVRELTDIWP
jgi:hypothetical protein